MVATRGRTFKRPWRRSCLSSKLKSSSAPIGRKDSWCFHAVGSSNAPLLGSTAAEGLPRIGRTSIATRWRFCGLPQSASCSENFVIPPDVFGQTLSVLRKTFGEAVPPLWRGLVRAPRRAAAGGVAWVRELGSLPTERRLEAALEAVRAEVARVLSLEGPGAVATDRPLKELGLDSLMALELRNALGKRAGKTLPAMLAFDYPTPAAIAGYLIATVLPRPGNINDHVPKYNPQKLVVAKLSEAAIELKNLFHKEAAATELDEATRISIEQFANVFIEQFAKLNDRTEISPACLRTVSSPKVRLFCFPCAGGRAESFQKWNPYL